MNSTTYELKCLSCNYTTNHQITLKNVMLHERTWDERTKKEFNNRVQQYVLNIFHKPIIKYCIHCEQEAIHQAISFKPI